MLSDVHRRAFEVPGWWLVLAERQLLTLDQGLHIPFGTLEELPFPPLPADRQPEVIGEYQGEPCYMLDLGEQPLDMGMGEFRPLRWLLGRVPEALFMLAGKATQVALFLKTHRFCGQCGQPMGRVDWELASHCDHCGHRAYPRISPSIIVAIRREREILLACHRRHRGPKPMYTVLAGFVEAGETAEQCVHREVAEEAGIQIRNLKYVASQPWPFPHSLMLGYVADYAGGELVRDPRELVDLGWYRFAQLPQLPPHGTIARRLIEYTRKRCR